MSIILKHIFRNIKEHKARSFLIFLALFVSTCVLIINIVLPDEIYLKIEDTFKTIYGNSDISISTVEEFKLEDINFNDTEYDYLGFNSIEALDDNNKMLSIYGIDIDKAKEFKMIGEDAIDLDLNEVIINEYTAKQKGYKKGDIIKITYKDREYELTIKKIVQKRGIAALESDNDILITSLSNLNNIASIPDGMYGSIFLDVKDDDKVDDLIEYLNDNNENYIISKTIDIKGLKEEISFVRYIMILIFFMSAVMIYFVISSLNKITLAERIPVIGTFRSVGADRKKMNFILILENAMYGLFAGLFGSLAGIYLDRIVSKKFITTSGVELSKKGVSISPMLVIVGILFAILLQIFITAKEIMRTNKKPIKVLIFNTQNSRYKIRKFRTILGFIFLLISFVLYFTNKKIDLMMTMVSLALLIIGVANIVPLLMQLISKGLAKLFKKVGWASGIIASKNIGYNKMIISSSRLIVVSLSLLSSIILVSNSFTKVFTSFREVTKGYDVIISNVHEKSDKYDSLVNIDGVNRVNYLYYYFDDEITYNDGKKFKTKPVFYASDYDNKYIDSKIKPKDLKSGEVLVDEKIAFKNDLKVGDTLNISFGSLNKTFEYKIVGLCDSTFLSSSRNTIVVNFEHFINDLNDIPIQIHVVLDDGVDKEDMKETLKDEIKEVNLKVQTVDEYIDMQEKQSGSIMGIFYVILGLSVILSFIGIVNNQIISFIGRKRELAVLNSTCMSRGQLKKMLIAETVLANLVASVLVILVTYISTGYIDNFMQGIDMYIDIKFDLVSILKFVGIIDAILMLTLVIPIKRLKKMNIVNEIKYE